MLKKNSKQLKRVEFKRDLNNEISLIDKEFEYSEIKAYKCGKLFIGSFKYWKKDTKNLIFNVDITKNSLEELENRIIEFFKLKKEGEF